MDEEVIKLINELVEYFDVSWISPNIVLQIVSIIITTIFSFMMYRVAKNQKNIVENQQTIQNNQFKYELFEKRYKIYKTTFILGRKLCDSNKYLEQEYKEEFEDCITVSEFLFNNEFQSILQELYNLALVRDKIKMILNDNYSIEALIKEQDLIVLKWNIKLEEFLKLDESQQKISLDERSLAIPL